MQRESVAIDFKLKNEVYIPARGSYFYIYTGIYICILVIMHVVIRILKSYARGKLLQ